MNPEFVFSSLKVVNILKKDKTNNSICSTFFLTSRISLFFDYLFVDEDFRPFKTRYNWNNFEIDFLTPHEQIYSTNSFANDIIWGQTI